MRLERFPVGPATRAFRKRFYPEVELAEWNDWRWQARRRIRTLAELERLFVLSDDERDAVVRHQGSLPLGITPYYASLMSRDDALEPLRRTHIPVGTEYLKAPGEADDPLGEDGHTAVPGLVHRYPDRVLFLATGFCSTYCRYCTRSRMVGEPGGEYSFSRPQWEEALDYIAAHPEIRDVLISGGDPLTLVRRAARLSARALARHPPCRVRAARHQGAGGAADARHPLADQDPEETPSAVDEPALHPSRRAHPGGDRGLHAACRRRHSARQPDGAAQGHQRQRRHPEDRSITGCSSGACGPTTSINATRSRARRISAPRVDKGLEIMQGLRGHTTGYAVPTYVIDAPGGGGKIPLLPDYVQGRDGDDLILKNFEGKTYRYTDPQGTVGADRTASAENL